ncbi:glycerophosphodiester phosphodiesterase [Nitrospira sp. NS4]|uniref:glycerophosphodiester phosphodiesterase n=1 Tax=Nitrospira sp. NS4 TaxID=3414498 RepID=UPI003C2E8569
MFLPDGCGRSLDAAGVEHRPPRGAAGHAPENTLGEIQTGSAQGVDFVEIDVPRTEDHVLVVLHAEPVNRTTNGKGRIDRVSLQEVTKLSTENVETIPTIEDVLKAVAG